MVESKCDSRVRFRPAKLPQQRFDGTQMLSKEKTRNAKYDAKVKQLGGLPIAIVGTLFFSVAGFVEWPRSRAGPNSVLTHGTVIKRGSTWQWGIFSRPELTIRIKDSNTVARAVLSSNNEHSIPDTVSFYFDGDPIKEVFLRQERNPLLIAVPCLGATITMIWFLLSAHAWLRDYDRPKFRRDGWME